MIHFKKNGFSNYSLSSERSLPGGTQIGLGMLCLSNCLKVPILFAQLLSPSLVRGETGATLKGKLSQVSLIQLFKSLNLSTCDEQHTTTAENSEEAGKKDELREAGKEWSPVTAEKTVPISTGQGQEGDLCCRYTLYQWVCRLQTAFSVIIRREKCFLS